MLCRQRSGAPPPATNSATHHRPKHHHRPPPPLPPLQADALDFYTAWQLVHRWQPAPPAHPLHASRWVALLAGGAMDAEAHSEAAAAVLELLWATTRHQAPEVGLRGLRR